ncbi:MAG: hypothetical protein QOD76_2073 [Solirubrobacteraceae bacterium]|nr:hypothetical protein [Solirubrobacteraceae bacterium]
MSAARVGTLTAAAVAVAGVVAGTAGAAKSPRVDVMVVGRSAVLRSPVSVHARGTTVAVGRRRCAVGAGTALAALDAARRARGPSFRVRDYGACSRRARDSESLYVFKVGPDRGRGRDGWVYKIGRTVPSIGAADLSGRRLRGGQRVVWFYCRMGTGGCQRTLEVTLDAARVAPGAPVRVVVKGYDDGGKGRAIGDVTVELDGSGVLTAADGSATLTAPSRPGRYLISAQRDDVVPAFPVELEVT